MAEQTGKVFLVGSGLGGAAYLTVQAQQILVAAEVVLYDALIDGELLSLVPETCLKLDVGKRGSKPSTPQAEINRLLVQHCQEGKQVVRLKSGDPFIFGRAQAEVQALVEAGCAFEVIPGLSSALTAPLLAGIPLTDPVLSRSFTVLTANDPEVLDWQTFAQMETLVILMGGRSLPEIVRQLRSQGKSPRTPIAIIRWAGRPEQKIWQGTLGGILPETTGETLAPCVIVIGEVVRLREYMQPSSAPIDSAMTPDSISTSAPPPPISNSPLAGKTVLITRAANQSSQFSDRLQNLGAKVIDMPALEIVPPSSWEPLDQAISNLTAFHWLILTSANAVDSFFERLTIPGDASPTLAETKIAVVGEKTAKALEKHGLKPDFIPPEYVADSLAVHFPGNLSGAKILFPRVESGGRDVLVKDLSAQGAEVTEVAAYQSRCPDAIAPEVLEALQNYQVDVATFASSKTVRHFCQMLERSQPTDSWQSWLNGVCVASIGPQTSDACNRLLGRVDAEAQPYTLDGLIEAIEQWLER